MSFIRYEPRKRRRVEEEQEARSAAPAALSSLATSSKSQRREQRLWKTFREIDADEKGFISTSDLTRFARENGLPEAYVQPFMAAVLEGKHPQTRISFERFRKFASSQERTLRSVFESLDTDRDGQLSLRQMAAGLANICFNCPFSRCTYKCPPQAVGKLLSQHSSPTKQRSMSYCDFRRLFLLLPKSDMLVDYWLQASSPGLCDIGGCVVVRETAAAAKGSPWGHLLAGAAAGATSRTATAPLETIRLQAMIGAGAAEAGPLSAASKIVRQSGWRALYKGNLLNVLRSAPQKALDFFAFDMYKALLGANRSGSMTSTFAAAGLAGATSTAVLHPLEVLRSRLTCDVTGRYRGGLIGAARQIVATEGPAALYSGLLPSVLAILPEAAITYGMFDGLKRSHARLTGRAEAGVLPSIGFGVVAAFTGQMVAFPLEAVARRMQVQQQAARTVGVLTVLQQIVKKEGPLALYRGAGPAVLRVLPMAVVSFSTYELVRLWVTHFEEARALKRAGNDKWMLPAPETMQLTLDGF